MSISEQVSARIFPPFSLTRLLKTTFEPKAGQRICILIDLENPQDIVNFKFLENPDLSIQRNAVTYFYHGLKQEAMKELNLNGGEILLTRSPAGAISTCPIEPLLPRVRRLV